MEGTFSFWLKRSKRTILALFVILFEAVYLLTMGKLSVTISVLKNPGTIGKKWILRTDRWNGVLFFYVFWRDIVKPRIFGEFSFIRFQRGDEKIYFRHIGGEVVWNYQ